jgi:nondiscriminating glutamyl-tRNA synthetase
VQKRLTPDEIAARGDAPYAIRFIVPEGETVVDDMVQGPVKTQNKEFDDFIIVKPNGDPVFHLAVVVDDGWMKITHVIRGDDHLSNAMRHKMLFEALGYDVPKFAHLPMVLDENGKKYSKRLHGANLLDWRADGYLPSTMLNYLVLLGWTPKEEGRELFTPEELIEAFDEKRLGKSAGKFDLKKLQWLNGQHIRRMPVADLCAALLPIMNGAGLDTSTKDPEWLHRMAAICQEKIPTLNDIVAYTDFFFHDVVEYEDKAVKKNWQKDDVLDRMHAMIAAMENVPEWTADDVERRICQTERRHGRWTRTVYESRAFGVDGQSCWPRVFSNLPSCLAATRR